MITLISDKVDFRERKTPEVERGVTKSQKHQFTNNNNPKCVCL